MSNSDGVLRIMNLLFTLNAAPKPLPTDQIIMDSDLGYGSGNRASDLKKFHRDREHLAKHGIVIQEIRKPGSSQTEESSWAIDQQASYAAKDSLLPSDIEVLESILCEHLARPDIPYRFVLSGMLTKLQNMHRHTDEELFIKKDACNQNPIIDAIWGAFSLRRRLPFVYQDSLGQKSSRTVSIYGVFSLNSTCYFTGFDNLSNQIRTFRSDRVLQVYRPQENYSIPACFSLDDYLFLPFDFSDNEGANVTFSVPLGIGKDELESIAHGRGAISKTAEGRWQWHVRARDLNAAAAFALSHARLGMRPVEPTELRERWNSIIEREVKIHG